MTITLLRVLRQLARDSGYVLTGLPLSILSFTLVLTGLSLSAGLAPTLLGLPLAAGVLGLATTLGSVERRRLRLLGGPVAPVGLAPVRAGVVRGVLDRLADPRRWAAALHAVGALPTTVVTWSLTVAWWAMALGGTTSWFWSRFLPQDGADGGLTDLLGTDLPETLLHAVIGVTALATLPVVVRGCALVESAWARLLLTGASRRALRAEVAALSSRGRSAAAAETDALRRLERDLHDGPQQRLVRIAMDLSGAERRIGTDPDGARDLLLAARDQANETLAELRSLSRGIAPPVLADRGLAAAVHAVAARSSIPVAVASDLPADDRPDPATETAAYFVVCEALANTAKHSGAGAASVELGRVSAPDGATALLVTVTDDGVGGAGIAKGHGLAGLADRVEGRGGRLAVESPPAGGTIVTAHLPWTP